MAERATVFQVTQIGAEAAGTPGTHVAADKKLLATSIEANIKAAVQTYRAQGTKFPALAALGKEWVEAKITGMGAYQDIVFLLNSLICTAAPAQQGATTAYLHTFTVDNDAPDAVTTYSVEQGSSVRAHEFSYGLVTELQMDFSRESIELSGSMIGNGFTDASALTGACVEQGLTPMLPTEVSIYMADTYAGLPGTALLRPLKTTWKLGSRFNQLFVLNALYPSWVAHVETVPDMSLTMLLEADAQGMGPLTNMRAGSSKFVRIDVVSASLAGVGFPYKMTIDMCGKVMEPSEFSDEDGVYAIEWTLQGAYDPTWTKALEVRVYNTVAAI